MQFKQNVIYKSFYVGLFRKGTLSVGQTIRSQLGKGNSIEAGLSAKLPGFYQEGHFDAEGKL